MKEMPIYFVVKRLFDIFASFFGIVLTSPIWVIAIIGIFVSDPGPIFYKANRVGKNNKLFKMLKFRSMRVAQEADEKNFKADADRIFKFGAFIRHTKIDEIPQLLNVFLGQMAIVGPRPAAVDQIKIVRAGDNAIVGKVKPGLTGPAALYDYIYGDTIEDEQEYEIKVLPTRLKLDVNYIEIMCLSYDFKMIWYTVICIFASLFHKEHQKVLSRITETN